MKYFYKNPLTIWVSDRFLLIRYIFHRFFMDKYLEEEWAKVEGKSLEQFINDTFRSGDDAYYSFLEKFDLNDFENFKKQYVKKFLTRSL